MYGKSPRNMKTEKNTDRNVLTDRRPETSTGRFRNCDGRNFYRTSLKNITS